MGLVFVPDAAAIAAAERHRLQGRSAVEAGIQRAMAWLKQPSALAAITRTRCEAAGALREPNVKRAFLLHAGLSPAQHAVVMTGHPVVVPYAALPARSRALLPSGRPAWLVFYLYANPWRSADPLKLAVRAEPSGQTWLSCPPLDLVPAHYPAAAASSAALETKMTGRPDLEDLDPGEEAPAVLEWIADQAKLPILAEALPHDASLAAIRKLAASCAGLTAEEALDQVATFCNATWRVEQGWVLIQRRSVSG